MFYTSTKKFLEEGDDTPDDTKYKSNLEKIVIGEPHILKKRKKEMMVLLVIYSQKCLKYLQNSEICHLIY